MASDPTDATSVLRSIWQQTPTVQQELDEECSPTKVCRNMKDVTFDGYAEVVIAEGHRTLAHRTSGLPSELAQ